MKIAYLNPCGKLGGAETSLREILASVRAAEPEWELTLVLGEDGPLAPIARNLGVRVIVEPFPDALGRLGDTRRGNALWQLSKAAGATAGYARRLSKLLGEIKPDVIHTNGFKMHVLGAWTRPAETPLLWHIHDYVSTRRLMSRLLSLAAGRASAAAANSKSVAADLRSLFPKLRVETIYNGIDLNRFSPSGASIDLDAAARMEPAAPDTVRVGLVATFAHWKGHRVFLEALSRLSSETGIRGYVVGGPIYQTGGSQWTLEALNELTSRLGLAGKVGFTGFLEDSSAVMRSLDVVVHASTEPEPFGMVIIEGMACGKAVVASQAGGASELFEDGENALSHPPGDVGALAQQILRLARDPQLRREMGIQGRRNVQERFTGTRAAREFVSLYRDLCGAPQRQPAAALASSASVVGESK